MKLVFTDTFFDSLRRLRRHNTWWYRTYSLFRHKIPMFFQNIVRFRRELWNYREYDSSYSMKFFGRGIQLSGNYIEKFGKEIDEPRLKKVAMIRRAVDIINRCSNGEYTSAAEKELGYELDTSYLFSDEGEPENVKESNGRIFSTADEMEIREWDELWNIIKGTGLGDGSDIRGWWD